MWLTQFQKPAQESYETFVTHRNTSEKKESTSVAEYRKGPFKFFGQGVILNEFWRTWKTTKEFINKRGLLERETGKRRRGMRLVGGVGGCWRQGWQTIAGQDPFPSLRGCQQKHGS